MQSTNQPFFRHLQTHKTPHVLVTAEDEEFDSTTISDLQAEGFDTHYFAMGDLKPVAFTQKMHEYGNQIAGVNEGYAVVGNDPLQTPFIIANWSCYRIRCSMNHSS